MKKIGNIFTEMVGSTDIFTQNYHEKGLFNSIPFFQRSVWEKSLPSFKFFTLSVKKYIYIFLRNSFDIILEFIILLKKFFFDDFLIVFWT